MPGATTLNLSGPYGKLDFIMGDEKHGRVLIGVVGNAVTRKVTVVVGSLTQDEVADLITVLEYYKQQAADNDI